MVKRKKKGFFKFGRNPLKIWQSWVGAIILFFLPTLPSPFGFISVFSMLLIISDGFPIGLSPIIFPLLISTVLSGFFFGASFKKGRDNFIQYGVGFLILSAILLFIVASGGIG